jgi:glutathione S-transferase
MVCASMITLHHLNNSRSQRILWLLEELELPYEIVIYQRDAETRLAPEALKAVHPLGKSPVITDGAVVVAESGAIIEYLTRKHANGRLAITDPDAPEFADYLHWLHYAEGSAVTPMLFELYLRLLGGGNDQLSATVNAQIVQQLTYIEGALKQRGFFVGLHFTAADIQMTFVLEFAQASGRLSGYPRLQDYLRRMHDRAAYRRSIEKGGEYSLGQFGKRA